LEGSTHKQRATFYFKTRVKIGQGGPEVGKQKRKKRTGSVVFLR